MTIVNVLIVGAGVASRALLESWQTRLESKKFNAIGIVDDSGDLHEHLVVGVKILGAIRDLPRLLNELRVDTVIIAISRRDDEVVKNVMEIIKGINVRVLQTPTYEDLMCGMPIDYLRELQVKQVETLEDSVVRSGKLKFNFPGHTVFVTGAGGSIGSEVVRQLLGRKPSRIVCFDRDESLLLDLKRRADSLNLTSDLELVLGDIRDKENLFEMFVKYKPDAVIHAAALKHLNMLEQFPFEAWKTNVLGTINVIQSAQLMNVPIFVNVSTDKASSPSSALGLSKLITERLVAGVVSQQPEKCRSWFSVRFGNVTRSRGSVFETFEYQALRGGPLTVSHAEVRRFFISIERAASFILDSVEVADSGETLIPAMPSEVRILQLAQLIAQRFNPVPEIRITGLAPGEKIAETLFSDADGVTRSVDSEGTVAIRQKAIRVGDILDARVGSHDVLSSMKSFCV